MSQHRSRGERETLIIWNDADQTATIGTTSPVEARRLERRGYRMVPASYYPDGTVAEWRCPVDKRAIRLRRLHGGILKTAAGHRKGRFFTGNTIDPSGTSGNPGGGEVPPTVDPPSIAKTDQSTKQRGASDGE